MAFALGRDSLTPAEALKREWVVANGLGGYASSSVIGMNTRKYHGLLIAAKQSPSNRVLLLSKLEEEVTAGGKKYLLSTNQYPLAFFPEGYAHQSEFSFVSHPVFRYGIPGASITKEVRMLRGRNATLVTYRISSERELEFRIYPLANCRDVHSNESGTGFSSRPIANGVRVISPHPFSITSGSARFVPGELYYRDMCYEWEKRRKMGGLDTHYCPGHFEARLHSGEIMFCAWADGPPAPDPLALLHSTQARERRGLEDYYARNRITQSRFASALVLASDTFVAKRGAFRTIVAGYPWFSDWGRDAMASLPGIAVCTGRNGLARDVISLFLSYSKSGLIPNYFDSDDIPQYSSVDASLWLIHAAHYLAVGGGELESVRQRAYPAMCGIIESYRRGNPLARLDSDGLLTVLTPGSTWMDAKVGGREVTPRAGKPVEVNALWYNALREMSALAAIFHDNRNIARFGELASACRESFGKFYNHKAGCLYDVIEPYDPSVRPNQIFAVGLPYSALSELQSRSVFNAVQEELYTPLGLRTLSRRDWRYIGKYQGGAEERDSAYHQGTVWPWLMGAYIDSYVRVYPQKKKAALSLFEPFEAHMLEGAVGSVSEIFESDTLRPDGCVSQAWSVAELLRVYTELSVENE